MTGIVKGITGRDVIEMTNKIIDQSILTKQIQNDTLNDVNSCADDR
jgi:hypothetical protein